MSYPPPPGGPPPHGGPPPGGPGQPQGYPGPYGPPPQQPPWPQQWQSGPPPKKRGGAWKWLLAGVALLAVIGVTAAVTISVTSDSGGENDPTPSGETYGLASADDTGPVNIITEDPTCAAWGPINQTLAEAERNGWESIDRSIHAPEWSSEQRAKYVAVGRAMLDAADQTERLVRSTPHRAMRQLYEQFIAYARAYNDAIPQYEPLDNYLATVVADASSAIGNICATITYSSAQAWASSVPDAEPPSHLPQLQDPQRVTPFLFSPDKTCPSWEPLLTRFQTDTASWGDIDASKPATQWTPSQRSSAETLTPVIVNFANDVERLARQSDNGILQDFAVLAAQYRRAFVEALPSYTPADSYLSAVAVDLTNLIFDACKSVGD